MVIRRAGRTQFDVDGVDRDTFDGNQQIVWANLWGLHVYHLQRAIAIHGASIFVTDRFHYFLQCLIEGEIYRYLFEINGTHTVS